MQDGSTIRNGYPLDLDIVSVGSRIGMMRCSDGTLHYFFNGTDQGVACTDIPPGKLSQIILVSFIMLCADMYYVQTFYMLIYEIVCVEINA